MCYRTQVALRILCLPLGRWKRFVEGTDDGSRDQGLVDEKLLGILGKMRKEVKEKREAVKKIKVKIEFQREMLGRRWEQIDFLIEGAIKRIEE